MAAVERVTNYVGFPNTHTSISYKTSRPKVAPIWDTLVGHSCGTLLLLRTKRCEAARRAFRTRLVRDLPKSHASSLKNDRFLRDFLQKSRVESPKRAFRTRLPPNVTLRGCKTSVSYETSSKSHTSSLQNERFVRDFLQTSHCEAARRAFRTRLPPKVTRQVSKTSVSHETSSKSHMSKSAKRTFRTRLPPKVQRKHPSEHTHHAALPSSFVIPAPPNNIRSHANPNVTATFTSTTTHNLTIPCACHESFRVHTSSAHKVLRLPRNVTSVTPRNLTIPCACHENRTSTPQNPHKVLRLPRKVAISSHVSFNKIYTTPHVWNDFDPF